MKSKGQTVGLLLAFCILFLVAGTFANSQGRFNEDLLKGFIYRNLGPYRAGSWVTDFAVPESPAQSHLYTFYVATRNGGLWKTDNNSTTFEPVFDGQNHLSIGDVTLAPSNPEIVWVGTGEGYCARSSYSGDGVYKSTDSGKTWENMGLKDSHHIPRIMIHPKNPDIVYVAAMGHLFTNNEERGVFKTADGGKTWKKVLYINDKVGVIDLVMNPAHPNILYAAAYEMQRLPWLIDSGGPESAVYKTTDAGKTWVRLGGGLPGRKIGRIGLDIYRSNPNILYAVVENANRRPSTEKEAEQDRSQGLKPRERQIGGEIYRTEDSGRTWGKMNSLEDNVQEKASYSFGQIRVDPNNDKIIYVFQDQLLRSTDGGKTWKDKDGRWINAAQGAFGDNRAMWIDPQNSDRMILGNDGGVHITYDGGKRWDSCYNLPLGEFYAIGVDMEDPYNIYGGLQDHEDWKGPSNSYSGAVTLESWVTVGTGDGMFNLVDPTDGRWLYNTGSQGAHYRVDQKLGVRKSILPRRDQGKPPYRFVWCAPIHLSPHNSQVIYTGAQVLLRSANRGDTWQEISPDLSTNDTAKMVGSDRGGISWFAITTISESPVTPGVIWVGTSDGKVQVTKDTGKTWTDLTQKIASVGGREDCYVSRVFASHFQAGTAYVAKSGFRNDDFRPFLYKTTDFGATWTSLADDLPDRPINVIFEDKKNPNLLFLGNDGGVYVSIDGGKKWVGMKNNMPSVPVHDLLVHPRENDLVVGTYGRGLYITDITPLQELNEKILGEDPYFFKIEPKVQRMISGWGNFPLYGDKVLSTPNEPNAVVINYYLKDRVKEKVDITVTDLSGKELAKLEGKTDAGMNSVLWDMQRQLTKEEAAIARQRRRDGDAMERMVAPGEYLVVLEVGNRRLTQKARITKRVGWPVGWPSHTPEVIK
jgi:photosystem II stability/assembly factor-like uncharacterized protein